MLYIMRVGLTILILIAGFTQASAADHIAVEYGNSGLGVHVTRIAFQHDLAMFQDSDCRCDHSYWEVDLGSWRSRDSSLFENQLAEVGFTPVFRLQRSPFSFFKWGEPFLEGGLGFHYVSNNSIADTSFLTSTKFLFGDHLGFGFSFGKHNPFIIGLRFQHLSNANIQLPNPGINLRLIHLSYQF